MKVRLGREKKITHFVNNWKFELNLDESMANLKAN